MKKNMLLLVFSLWLHHGVKAQTVVIGTTATTPADPSAMLEIRKADVAKVNLRSADFADTAWLQLSNRNSFDEGTDFNIMAVRETGLFFNTNSDIAGQRNDSLFTMMRNGSIGIGTRAPTTKLDVVGSIRMRDGNQGNGRVMVSDANGFASWQPKTFGFAATGSFPAVSNRQTINTGVNTALNVINLEEHDGTNMYNAATGVVTIAESGVYHIDVSITYSQASNGIYSLSLVNGAGTIFRLATQRVINTTFIDNLQLNISTDLNCTAGQTLRLFTEQNSGASQLVFGAFYSWFNMHKLF